MFSQHFSSRFRVDSSFMASIVKERKLLFGFRPPLKLMQSRACRGSFSYLIWQKKTSLYLLVPIMAAVSTILFLFSRFEAIERIICSRPPYLGHSWHHFVTFPPRRRVQVLGTSACCCMSPGDGENWKEKNCTFECNRGKGFLRMPTMAFLPHEKGKAPGTRLG